MYLQEIQKVIQSLSDILAAAHLTNEKIEQQEIAPGLEVETHAAVLLLAAKASDLVVDICARLRGINPLLVSLTEVEAALKIVGMGHPIHLEVN